MKRVQQTILFFVFLGAAAQTAYVARSMGEQRFLEYALYQDKLDKIDEGLGADIVMLGESRTVGVTGDVEQARNHNLYNLSMPAVQGLFAARYMLERYLAHNPPPKAVIYGGDPRSYSGWRGLAAGGHFGAAPPLDYHLRYTSRIMAWQDILTSPDLWQQPRRLIQLARAKLALNKSYYDFIGGHENTIYEPETGTAIYTATRDWEWSDKDRRQAADPFVTNPISVHHLEQMLELAKAHDFLVVAYHPPIYEESHAERARLGFYDDYWRFMHQMQAKYPRHFHAWSRIEPFPHDAFIDGRHYSLQGSKKVAQQSLAPLLSWLKSREGPPVARHADASADEASRNLQ